MPIDYDDLIEAKTQDGTRYYRVEDGKEVCGKQLRGRERTTRCNSPAIFPANGRCKLHGGPRAKDRSSVVPGRWSRKLGRWREAYEEAVEDEGLSDMRRTLAALDLNVTRSAERMSELDTPRMRTTAHQIWQDMDKAASQGDVEGMMMHHRRLGQLLEQGCTEDEAIEDFARAADRMMKRQHQFWQTRLAQKYAMSVEDVKLLLGRFFGELTIALDPERIREIPCEQVAVKTLQHLDGAFGKLMKEDEPAQLRAAE